MSKQNNKNDPNYIFYHQTIAFLPNGNCTGLHLLLCTKIICLWHHKEPFLFFSTPFQLLSCLLICEWLLECCQLPTKFHIQGNLSIYPLLLDILVRVVGKQCITILLICKWCQILQKSIGKQKIHNNEMLFQTVREWLRSIFFFNLWYIFWMEA